MTDKNRTPTLITYGATDQRVGIEVVQTATSLPGNVHLLELDRAVSTRSMLPQPSALQPRGGLSAVCSKESQADLAVCACIVP